MAYKKRSPLGKKPESTIAEDYQNIVNQAANFKGTKSELRDFLLKNNKGKKASDKGRIGLNVAIELWRKNNPESGKERRANVPKEKTTVTSTPEKEPVYYFGKSKEEGYGASDRSITEEGVIKEGSALKKRGFIMKRNRK